jgi:hypothetical protein
VSLGRRGDRELERRLRELRAPDEAETEERSLDVVRAAYEDHVPPRPSRTTRRVALGVGCGAVALVIGLSPAGARVGDFVSDVFDRSDLGEPNAKPQLRSLPAPGQLLVQSARGPWIVQTDGSKRLLGDFGAAAWSPNGIYVAVANDHELAALDTEGNTRWTHPASGRVSHPVWSSCCDEPVPDQRIAYMSGNDLRVIDADGSDDRLIARNVATQDAVWRDGSYVLTYMPRAGRPVSLDVDTRERIASRGSDVDQASLSPVGETRAIIRSERGQSRLVLVARGDRTRTLFDAPGRLTGPTWSPDGQWLLVGWPDADQWLFIPVARGGKGVYFDRISEQFAPGATSPAKFPRVLGWAPEPPAG